jgi:hypothetical protein
MLDGLMARANADPILMRRARFLDLVFGLDLGEGPALIKVAKGHVSATKPASGDKPVFTISAPKEAWDEFRKPMPKPGFHHVMAMNEHRHARLEGDVYPLLVNLFFVTGLLSKLRQGEAA